MFALSSTPAPKNFVIIHVMPMYPGFTIQKKFISALTIQVIIAALVHLVYAQSNLSTIQGTVLDENGIPIENVSVLLSPTDEGTVTDGKGHFVFENLRPAKYTLILSHLAYRRSQADISVDASTVINQQFVLIPVSQMLTDVQVVGKRVFNTMSFLPQVQGTDIFAGKKATLINMRSLDADLAENLPRQIFSKIPGAMVWEMDGTGNQVGISTRGLIPHRSWELHIQQNGNTTNSDLFGYPESHYNPPMEAVGEIKLIRGSGALQYGPQFGGLLDYEIKQPDTTHQISLETQQTAGSFGLFSSFNALGGKVGKVTYYGYYDFRRSNGWRQNSDYHFTAWHTSVKYDVSNKVRLCAELSHMQYLNHFAAGLTDSLFAVDPRYSNRPRNYFNPTIYVPAIHASWRISDNTIVTAKSSAILGERNSVQFITLPTVDDTINVALNNYNPRQVDRDYYHSYAAEVKLLQNYHFLKNDNHFAVGIKYSHSRTLRKQKGKATGGTDFDLSLTAPYKIDLVFKTANYALFAENVFNITKRLSVTPGFRLEIINTDMSGTIMDLPSLNLPYTLERKFPLFGAGLEYQVSPALDVYANFTQNFRPVLHSDLIPPTDLDRIDPNLDDAKGNNAEIGIRGTVKDILQFDLNYFRLQYDNRIGTLVLSDQNGPYFYHTNTGDMLNQGGEFYLEIHPFNLMTSPSKFLDFTLFTSTSYNSAEYTRGTISVSGENRDIKGNTVENVPHWISRNGISYSYRKFSATLQLSYVSENFSDALNTTSTPTGVNGIVPSYFLTDFNMTYYFLHRYNIRLSVNNISDKQYFTRRATGYPGPGILPSDGRSMVVTFGAKF